MEIKTAFKVTVRCKKIEESSEDSNQETYSDKTIDLYLNSTDAMMILFKFTPVAFKLSNGMFMYMRFAQTPENKLSAMILTDINEDKYLVLNPTDFWSEVLEAYEEIRLIERLRVISSIANTESEE